MWQTTRKKKLENNPNHAPSGDSKGGQFTKGDGGSGSDDDKKDEPKSEPKKDVFDVSSYQSDNGRIAIKVDKVIDSYERHVDIAREIWNDIPTENKQGINKFNIGKPPSVTKNASGTFDPRTNTLGLHINNISVDDKSSSEEIKNMYSSVMIHEVAHSQFHRFSEKSQSDWSTDTMTVEPITDYLKKFRKQVIKTQSEFKFIQTEWGAINDELDKVDKEIRSGKLSDKSDDIMIPSPLQRAITKRDSLDRQSDNKQLQLNIARQNKTLTLRTYGNETHSEYNVMLKGHKPLWKSDPKAFEKLKPIFDKHFGDKK